jgi:hypothetical protein
MMNALTVIRKLQAIGCHLKVDGDDILLTADKPPDADVATLLLGELKRCKAEAVTLLQRDKVTRRAEWPAEVKALIDRFIISPPPEAPFRLNGHTRVIDADLFYTTLRQDIEAGPNGPRARYGAVQCDLRDLKTILH